MKKFFALCSMIVALGFVTGCGGGDTIPATGPGSPGATSHNDDATATEGQESNGDSDENDAE